METLNRKKLTMTRQKVMVVASAVFLLLALASWVELRPDSGEGTARASSARGDSEAPFTNSIGMRMVLIPVGEFMMGSPAGEKGRYEDEGTQHRVEITKPFHMGAYEVTQGEYEAIMGTKPSHFEGANNPVENVPWADATEFCRRLSEKEGREYRLPTEAEWEYACRAGSTVAYCFGDDTSELGGFTWYWKNSGERVHRTHPVGEKKPNAWGLYDMHGNVWEWCNDRYRLHEDHYNGSPVRDPQGPSGDLRHRRLRGGSFSCAARLCRSATRNWYEALLPYKNPGFGFRVVCAVKP